ncbi:MAG TPA: hypothetical protein VH371_02275 [Candidatus Limnocylindrales bacterium]
MRVGRWAAAVVVSTATLACSSVGPLPSLPADASPAQVLQSFLEAVEAGNCAGAQTLEAPDRDVHILCSASNVHLNGYGPLASADPSLNGANAQFCFPVTLAGTPIYEPPFDALCVVLTKQRDGRWLVASDGTGP